jgi:hypothetical protein
MDEHAQLAATVGTHNFCKHLQHSRVRLSQGGWDVGAVPHPRCLAFLACLVTDSDSPMLTSFYFEVHVLIVTPLCNAVTHFLVVRQASGSMHCG